MVRKLDVVIKDDSDDVMGIVQCTTQERLDLQVQLPTGWTAEVIQDDTVSTPKE